MKKILIGFIAIVVVLAVYIFIKSQTKQKNVPEGMSFCGGIANIQCPQGYSCVIKDKYPDAGGYCVGVRN